ncbi:putative PilL-like protein [Candidatus Burkholderia humilis]|nr:putative PilL-like protein [Candidatus Burkholderia humilis]
MLERPALVFNDGSDTYFQPRAGQSIKVDGGHIQGPYIVVAGTPEVIHYTAGGSSATAFWKKANRFIGDKVRGDMPAGFAGFSGRLALIGEHSSLESTRALNATLLLSQLVKALVPQGWTGSAQKDIDLTSSMSFATREGENWMQSLDRLVAASDLYADVDFDTRHVSLRRSVPQSVALNYVVSAAAAIAQPSQGSETTIDPIADIAKKSEATVAPPAASVLAAKFGALAIRDGDDSHIQIKFTAKLEGDLKIVDASGKSLRPKWDDVTNVVTFNRAERFTISNATDKVEVARVAGAVYVFDTQNKAALQRVFDQDGSTFFKFADTVGKVTVADVAHMGSGEQKGRYYKSTARQTSSSSMRTATW